MPSKPDTTTADSHCYHVAKRRPLATPIPALGALGLWGAPPGVAVAIRERLPGLWPAEGT